ncbi:MAG: sulfatase-like hydrolase/transferase, partial [Bacteroidota bacterium]
FLLFLSSCQPEALEKRVITDKPNILLIIADDMGYADIGCYGGKANTPNLDKLAKNGMLFTNFYAAAPNCSPSRTGLLTGRSPSRVGMYSYRPANHPMHLRKEEITIAEVLQKENYQTAHFGKWHLGALPADSIFNHPQPKDQGFSYSLGTENNAIPSHLNPINFVRNGKKIGEQKGYSCQLVVNEALSWLDTIYDEANPFFMYIAFHEPHKKVASPPELVDKYQDLPSNDAAYLANVENLDIAVGRLLERLRKNGELDNTLIMFSSDNGSYRQASNGQLKAKKSYVYEGGIRVPAIFSWPNQIEKGRQIDKAAGFVDVFPTICHLLNITLPTDRVFDGSNIWPLLKGEKFERQKPLYWFFYRTSPEMAMRIDGQIILGISEDTLSLSHQFMKPDMDYIRNMQFASYELYNPSTDISQKNNLIEQVIDADSLKTLLNNYLKEIQQEGYYWKNLPLDIGSKQKKRKEDWVSIN